MKTTLILIAILLLVVLLIYKMKKDTTKEVNIPKKKSGIKISNVEKRNEFLKKHGNTVKKVVRVKKDKPVFLSHYKAQVLAYMKAKREKNFKTYRNENGKLMRNRQGIPFYNIQ